MKHGKRQDVGRHADDAHGGVLDIDKVLVERRYVILVHSYTAILVQERKTVVVPGAVEKNVGVDGGAVFQMKRRLAHALDTCDLYHVDW